ncbi:MAG: hypothetical protein HGA82_03355 [Anaerolineales bacterium]|nr:hypothetical protein [Anaerolineales bacterium]
MDHIHLIGIGGSGMSAIARLLQESGFTVSGSDRAESPYTRDLAAAGVTIHIGHQAGNVQGADLVVRSSAIADDNIEVSAARSAGIAVLKRAEYLGSLMEGRTGIAVAGTHGKTTTTAMLAWVLTALGQDPAFICGGTLTNLGVNARAGKGAVFVIEADEYDRMFLGLKPSLAIVTNVEHDHPDCDPTPEDFHRAFVEFEQRQWAGLNEGRLQGVLAWTPTTRADLLWLACSSDADTDTLAALLSCARRELGYQRKLLLEHPAGRNEAALLAAGFELSRTLVWMRAYRATP